MRKFIVAIGVAILALAGLSVGLAGDASHVATSQGEGDERAAIAPVTVTTPFTWYLPIVARNYAVTPTTIVTVPVTMIAVHSAGQDHVEAYDPSGGGVFLDSSQLVVSLHTWDYGQYRIDRTYLAAEIPDCGRVVSAGLSLVPCAYWYTDQDPLPPPTVTLHLGTWPGFLADRQTLWGAWAPDVVLGEFDATAIFGLDCYAGETQRTLIPLDPEHVHPGQTLKLAVRDSEDHVDLRPSHNQENRVFGAYDLGGQVWLEIGFEGSGG